MVYDYAQKLVLSGICQNLGGGGMKEYCLIGIEFLFCKMKRVLEVSCTKSTYLTLLKCIQEYPDILCVCFWMTAIKQVTWFFFSFWFPSAYKSYVYIILWLTVKIALYYFFSIILFLKNSKLALKWWSESPSFVSDSLQPNGLHSSWNSPGQNTGLGSLSLLQGIFLTQGSNPGILHCRWILYQLIHKGSPNIS